MDAYDVEEGTTDMKRRKNGKRKERLKERKIKKIIKAWRKKMVTSCAFLIPLSFSLLLSVLICEFPSSKERKVLFVSSCLP